MRLLIILLLGYLGYRALKSWMLSQTAGRHRFTGRSETRIDDVMVKDPYCNTYFPRRHGVSLTIEGREFCFCSKECRDNYIASRSEKEA